MGNQESRVISLQSIREEDEDEPRQVVEDMDDMQTSYICPKCGNRFVLPRMLYNKHSVCKPCLDDLKKGARRQSRVKENLMHNMESTVAPADPTSMESNDLPDLKINLGFTKYIDTYDEQKKRDAVKKQGRRASLVKNPVMTKRDVLDKVNKSVDVEYIDDCAESEESSLSELPKNPLSSQRKQTVIPAYFKRLANGTWIMEGYLRLEEKPNRIILIQGNIWCMQENYITAWTTELEPIEWVELDQLRFKHDLMTEIQSAAELKSRRIVVACGSGLFLLTERGKYDGRITEGCYTDVSTCGEVVYAAMFGLVYKAKVRVYDEAMPWVLIRTIALPVDGFCTIHLSDQSMEVCNATHGGIYITDLLGTIITKSAHKGVYGRLGQFHEPRICQGAKDGSILIADRANEMLQVRTFLGEWGPVRLDKKVKGPASAVFAKKHLFVLQTEPPYKIIRYM